MTDAAGAGAPAREPIRLKQLRKRAVVDTSTAETLGRVRGVRIDPRSSRVVAIVVGDEQVPLDRLEGIGPDAVTVSSRSALVPDDDALPRDSDAYGSRLLDDGGTELGKLGDLVMAPDGEVVGVVTGEGDVPARLRGIGSYAVVIARA